MINDIMQERIVYAYNDSNLIEKGYIPNRIEPTLSEQPLSPLFADTLTDCESVEYSGYVFSCGKEANHILLRTHKRTSEKGHISDSTCQGFTLDNGQVYYATSTGIYKLFFNQKDSRFLISDSAFFPVFTHGYLYYANQHANGAIYRIKPDGCGREMVCSDNAWYLFVYNGHIFYSDEFDGFSLNSIVLDGFQKIQYGARGCHHIRVDGGWVVFSHEDSDGAVCKLNIHTKEMIKLSSGPSVVVAARGGVVYYKTDNYGAIHELSLNGRK